MIISWSKLDTEYYISQLQSPLPHITVNNIEASVNSVTDSIVAAASRAVPSKVVKLKGPKRRVPKKFWNACRKLRILTVNGQRIVNPDLGVCMLKQTHEKVHSNAERKRPEGKHFMML